MTASLIQEAQSSAVVTAVSTSLILICFLIAIISQISTGAQEGQIRLNWPQVLMRLFAVIIFIQAAGPIQGYLWNTGKDLGKSILPGPTIADIHGSLKERVDRLRLQQRDASEREGRYQDSKSKSILDTAISAGLGVLGNWITNIFVYGIESLAITVMYFGNHWLLSVQAALMSLLAALAPIVFPASIIPGINTWSNWLKLVVSIALWPVISGFLIKAHVFVMSEFIGTGSIIGANANNLFINMDTLSLLGESIFFLIIMFSTPAIAVALVHGAAGPFATGAGLLLSSAGIVGMSKKAAVTAPRAIIKAGPKVIGGTGVAVATAGAFAGSRLLKFGKSAYSGSPTGAATESFSGRYPEMKKNV